MNTLEKLQSVLCDPENRCSIVGTDADRAEVDAALVEVANLQRELDAARQEAGDWKMELESFKATENEHLVAVKAENERLKDNYQTILDSHMLVTNERNEARAQVLAMQSCERSMREALIAADEAMVWELGGEPIPTLMIEARAKIKAAIAGQPKPQECGRCDNGEPCTNQYGICSRNGGWHHGELPVPIYGDSQPPFVTELAKVGDVVSAERFGNEPAKWFINGVEVSEPKTEEQSESAIIERKLNQAAATGDVNHYIRAVESAREEFGDE